MEAKPRILDNIKTLFQRKNSSSLDEDRNSPKPIPVLSPLANSVVARCSTILKISTEQLQNCFDVEMPDSIKQSMAYARNLLEFCSYKALNVVTTQSDYLGNKEFRRLIYDMMLAWETPGAEGESIHKATACSNQGSSDEDGGSFFHSSSYGVAVQVDDRKSVGPEAFLRIAPACAAVADVVTAQNLFDALTSSSGHRLHFLIFDKYIQTFHRVIKTARNFLGASSNLQLSEGEIVLDVDGTVPTQPVLQHVGISAWPGRLTLTNCALYFESLGVGLYDKPIRYDLSMDLKQVVKPELTGPLGARLFDKAVMYKSTSVAEPVYLEFPEFKGSSRRDYWLDVCLEILRVHRFIRKYNLKGIQRSEAIARATLAVFRCRAVREAFHVLPSHYKTLLPFNLAESLPGGDAILETLSSQLAFLDTNIEGNASGLAYTKQQLMVSPVSLLTLSKLRLTTYKGADVDAEAVYSAGYVCVGETNLLEKVVKQSKLDTGEAEAAQATVNQFKVDGIDTNLSVMKELLFPIIFIAKHIQNLALWEDPLKSAMFLLLMCYTILSGWIGYILPSILVFLAVLMLWRRYINKGKPVKALKITPPPNQNAVERLITLQEAVAQVETLIQAGNIILLKIRALLFAVLPQATERVAVLMVVAAMVFAFVPLRHIILLGLVEAYTREMPLRKDSSYRFQRRIREWWYRIPAAPVQLVEPDDSKKRK
ncbi:hypothetical protein Nepgr_014323 [Nepenthes gracilis]|uniref:Uncharacterized protein n=1 Tax=Nepenthes gracilis TaxID=150966 RepID=A0AAD3SL08_NEPGR|nr:hypothetical protein Nepgr_014323 [Nepenthes gracilis]